jgi:hypothetical protein
MIKTLNDLIDYYRTTPQFLSLRMRTQKDYDYCIKRIVETFFSPKVTMGRTILGKIGVSECKIAYQEWLNAGVRQANMTSTVASILFNLAVELELMPNNPMRLGVAYAFAQRIGDMRTLEWSNINFEERRLDLEQSKKRAEVHLPIHIHIYRMLEQQHKDFGFQKYVAPHPHPRNGGYVIYTDIEISRMVNRVKEVAGLPKELTAMDMRRTAITEMVEAGVDTTQIMAVSGHSSPNSMRPYIRHTYKSAASALERREISNGEQT